MSIVCSFFTSEVPQAVEDTTLKSVIAHAKYKMMNFTFKPFRTRIQQYCKLSLSGACNGFALLHSCWQQMQTQEKHSWLCSLQIHINLSHIATHMHPFYIG